MKKWANLGLVAAYPSRIQQTQAFACLFVCVSSLGAAYLGDLMYCQSSASVVVVWDGKYINRKSIAHIFKWCINSSCKRWLKGENYRWGLLPSPPSFKGRKWGKSPSLHFSLCCSRQCIQGVVQSVHNFTTEVMVFFIYFYHNVGGCCAAEYLYFVNFFIFFFFGTG